MVSASTEPMDSFLRNLESPLCTLVSTSFYPDHVINVFTGERFKITSFKGNLWYNKVGVSIVKWVWFMINYYSYLSKCLSRKFDHVAESVLPVLITVLQSSAKVRCHVTIWWAYQYVICMLPR